MTLDIRTNLAILNIFKNDVKHVRRFIAEHAPQVRMVFMLDTGSNDGSLAAAREEAARHGNVTVLSRQFDETDFSAFRNACLDAFMADIHPGVTHCLWVDTDERLVVVDEPELADAYSVEREDSTGLFSTWLTRGFSIDLRGEWKGLVHEGFSPDRHVEPIRTPALKLIHLESETQRSAEKKRLYFYLIQKQLRRTRAKRDIAQLASMAIQMASFDLQSPVLCARLYDKYGAYIRGKNITELNALIHSIRALSELGRDANDLARRVIDIHPAKSTVYQVLRGLLLNFDNTVAVKKFYETEYPKLPDNIVPDYFNGDFTLPSQVEIFERRIRRQLNLLQAGFDNA